MTKLVDVSIDFDFFVREELAWDWGHGEEGPIDFARFLWNVRYRAGEFNLFREMDPTTHADFLPHHIVDQLRAKGLSVRYGPRRLGIADSHVRAFEFFTSEPKPAHVILNIDAHHDLFSAPVASNPLDCGNWLAYLLQEWPKTQIVQLYPKWKSRDWMEGEIAQGQVIAPDTIFHRWTNWSGFKAGTHRLRNIFICRSPVWTPPHLDELFLKLVFRLLDLVPMQRADVLEPGGLFHRDHPTEEEHTGYVAEHQEVINKYRESHGHNVKVAH